MNNKIITFCNKYKEYLKSQNNKKMSIRFAVNHTSVGYILGFEEQTINLDEEDLKYLYDKYSKKLQKEMEKNINEIKKLYESNN